MRTKIWYTMVNLKYGEIYLTKYLGVQRRLKKGFQVMTLIVSISGIFGWKYFEDYTWVAFLLISLMQLLLLVESSLIRSDKEVEEIGQLKMMYTRYFNKSEKLWTEFDQNRIREKAAREKYFKYRESYWEKIEELDGKLDIKKYKRLITKTEIETTNYINRYHVHE